MEEGLESPAQALKTDPAPFSANRSFPPHNAQQPLPSRTATKLEITPPLHEHSTNSPFLLVFITVIQRVLVSVGCSYLPFSFPCNLASLGTTRLLKPTSSHRLDSWSATFHNAKLLLALRGEARAVTRQRARLRLVTTSVG